MAKEICHKIHLQSDAASDERLLLGDVQKILVRLGSVEAQVSSCRQMFETSKAQEQQNLDRNSEAVECSWIFSPKLLNLKSQRYNSPKGTRPVCFLTG